MGLLNHVKPLFLPLSASPLFILSFRDLLSVSSGSSVVGSPTVFLVTGRRVALVTSNQVFLEVEEPEYKCGDKHRPDNFLLILGVPLLDSKSLLVRVTVLLLQLVGVSLGHAADLSLGPHTL